MFAIIKMVTKMKIDKITKQKNGKYKIIFNNKEQLITYDEVILKNNLLQNKELDYEKIHQISLDNEYYNIYNKVLKYISIKMRSLKEINEYLKKFNIDDEEKLKIISKLKEIGLINDKVFVKSFINDRFNLSNDGPLLIKKELLKHDIDSNIIDEFLKEIKEEDINNKLDRLINKKIKSNHKYSNYLLKQKITKDLSNLGFDYNTVLNRVDFCSINDNDILLHEFNKLYKKYSSKLNSPKLELKVRQSLYQKGFKIEQINKLLDEKNVQ